nr:hypothetical protein CFP56_31761 [Quercus suber]
MDDFDGDDGFGYEDNWLYVEDEFALADELAESQTADPGYPGTNYEIELETYEYELYEFWDDMEYADDEYWDYGPEAAVKKDSGLMGHKRKRNAPSDKSQPDKKRKVLGRQPGARESEKDGHFPVYFLSMQDQLRFAKQAPPVLQNRKPVALLADWRERFPEDEGVMLVEMPKDMKRAADAEDDEMQESGEDEWSDESGSQEADKHGSLNLETLKMVLRQRMTEAGLEGVDEDELMETISKMMNGEGDPEDAAGELANSLLGQASQGNEPAFTGWLSQQGVSLEDEEDDSTDEIERVPASTSHRIANEPGSEDTQEVETAGITRRKRATKSAKKLESGVTPANGSGASVSSQAAELPASSVKGTKRTSASTKPTSSFPTAASEPPVRDVDVSRRKPAATKASLKRKAPASNYTEAETSSTAQRAHGEPAVKRTRSGRTR